MKTKKEARAILSEGNLKIHKDILVWNLPAGNNAMGGTCNMVCDGCYAMKAQKIYPNVMPSRVRKLDLANSDDFMDKVIGAINKLNKKEVRIHESGDFYSQKYINKWCYIASSLPNVTFLAYTKQMSRFDFSALKSLPNVIIVNSLQYNKMNFSANLKDGLNYGFVCPATTSKDVKGCGHDCDICYNRENKATLESKGIFFKLH